LLILIKSNMSQSAVVKLIKTLSSSEKRHFKLQCRKQSGSRDYLGLFDIIDQMKAGNSDLYKKNSRQLSLLHQSIIQRGIF